MNSKPNKYCHKTSEGFAEIFERENNKGYSDIHIDSHKLLGNDSRGCKCNFKILILLLGAIVIFAGIGALGFEGYQRYNAAQRVENSYSYTESGHQRKKRNISNETDISPPNTSTIDLHKYLLALSKSQQEYSEMFKTFVNKFAEIYGPKSNEIENLEEKSETRFTDEKFSIKLITPNSNDKVDHSENVLKSNSQNINWNESANNSFSNIKKKKETHPGKNSFNRIETLNSETAKETLSSSTDTVTDSEILKPISKTTESKNTEKTNENRINSSLPEFEMKPSEENTVTKTPAGNTSTITRNASASEDVEDSTTITDITQIQFNKSKPNNLVNFHRNETNFSRNASTPKYSKFPKKRDIQIPAVKYKLVCHKKSENTKNKHSTIFVAFVNQSIFDQLNHTNLPMYSAHSLHTHKKFMSSTNFHEQLTNLSNLYEVMKHDDKAKTYCTYMPVFLSETDVPRAADEECNAGQRKCETTLECINKTQWCDNKIDCEDDSDELNCSCKDRVHEKKLCDGYFDCPNGEDELGCFGCSGNQISCKVLPDRNINAKCIDVSQRCNGVPDCGDEEDEEDCELLAENLYSHETFLVSYTTGYLHRNWKGKWYPVCQDENQDLSHNACKWELGADLITDPKVYDKSYSHFDGEFITYGPKGIEVVPQCQKKTVIYVQCPDELCGTRMVQEIDLKYNYKREIIHNSTTEFTNPRVVGGNVSQAGAWPWIVAIYKNGIFHCGGVILDDRWIMTAAHCVTNYGEGYYEIQAGTLRRLSFSPMEQIRKVSHIIAHSDFEHGSMKNDIALMELAEPLRLNRWIRPICLPEARPPWGPKPGSTCTAIGWGAVAEHGPDPDHMRDVNLPILSECKHQPDREVNSICAGYLRGGHDTCQGDSGGPFLCRIPDGRDRWYIAGIVSHGEGCARPDEPGVYTRVPLYIPWLIEHTDGKFLSSGARPQTRCLGLQCQNGGRCIAKKRICDRVIDCLNGEDELNCDDWMMLSGRASESAEKANSSSGYKSLRESSKTAKNSFTQLPNITVSTPVLETFANFTCRIIEQEIPLNWFCDGEVDCQDGTDEIKCTCLDFLNSHNPNLKCNGIIDCQDMTDEINCTPKCTEKQFHCYESSACIRKSLNCDGRPDCPHGEDERDCYALVKEPDVNFDLFGRPIFAQSGLVMRNEKGLWSRLCLPVITSQLVQIICQAMGFAYHKQFDKVAFMENLYPDLSKTCYAVILECVSSRLNENETLPWKANIYINGELRCIGLLINDEWIIVDSNCYKSYNSKEDYILAVLGGSKYLEHIVSSYGEQIINVDYVHYDQNLNSTAIHLKSPVNRSLSVKPLTYMKWVPKPDTKVKCLLLAGINPAEPVFLYPNSNCTLGNVCFKPQNKIELCEHYQQNAAFTLIVCVSKAMEWYPVASIDSEIAKFCSQNDDILQLQEWVKPSIILGDQFKPNNLTACSNNGHRCALGKCIPPSQLCDGKPDCRNNEDESQQQCDFKKTYCDVHPLECSCKIHEFRCKSLKCISMNNVCDNKDDCGDRSDEPLECSNFTCATYLNITSPHKLCDSLGDCKDKSDENLLNCRPDCDHPSYFKCSGTNSCIPLDFVCDGEVDCPHNEDEAQCMELRREKNSELMTLLIRYKGKWEKHCMSPDITNFNPEHICKSFNYEKLQHFNVTPGVKSTISEYRTVKLKDKEFSLRSKTTMHSNLTETCNHLHLTCQ